MVVNLNIAVAENTASCTGLAKPVRISVPNNVFRPHTGQRFAGIYIVHGDVSLFVHAPIGNFEAGHAKFRIHQQSGGVDSRVEVEEEFVIPDG